MNEYMEIAKGFAQQNMFTNDGGPFGACVVKNNKIIGMGSNHVLKDNDPTAHAEIMAIRDACENEGTYDLTGCDLYTTCFPCPMCLSAAIWANLKTVYYGNTKEDAERIGFRDNRIYEFLKNMANSNEIEMKCIDREETIKLFKEFDEKTDKKIY